MRQRIAILALMIAMAGCQRHEQTKREYIASHHCILDGEYGKSGPDLGTFKVYEYGAVREIPRTIGHWQSWSCPDNVSVFIGDGEQ